MNHLLLSAIIGLAKLAPAFGQCFADESMNTQWAQLINGDTTSTEFSIEGSCCQETVCAIPCQEEVEPPAKGFGIAVMCAIAFFVVVGFASVFVIKGKAENFFVAGRSLPLFVVTATLASQSIDANAILGAATLSYKYHFWDGAVLPLGLGLSLILNAIFLARHVNNDNALTLPDILAKRYGKVVEVLASLCTIVSFLCLLAGNLVGMGAILSYLLGMSLKGAIALSTILVFIYTVAGGLYSVAYTDVLQSVVGWIGCISLAFYMIANETWAPPVSIGFPDYVYPDDESCAMYEGVPCNNDPTLCCYNAEKWCPDDDNCVADNGAYPIGDQRIFDNQMTDAYSLSPFPNAIVFNWATIFVLGFGNLAALDFQARCMASKTPRIATIGCLIAGCLTFVVGIPFAYMGAITRVHYGPDSTRAAFETDSCHELLGLPTCALWLPDEESFIKLLTHEAPPFLGGWCLIGIVAASMSTCDGAILAMGTVFSHNVMRNVGAFFPAAKGWINEQNLLMMARIASGPLAAISMLIAMFANFRHSAGATGYLLIVAFDVVLASVVVPLFGCFYTKKPSPLAALCALLTGVAVRIILEIALPKDGYLVAPFSGPEFLNTGPAASTAYPVFFDQPEADIWDPSAEKCDSPRFEDWTGVDSLAAPIAGLIVFVIVQYLEKDGPLNNFAEDGVMAGYLKETQKNDEGLKAVELADTQKDVTGHETGHDTSHHVKGKPEDKQEDTAKVTNDDADSEAEFNKFVNYVSEKDVQADQ